jgi:hypothetical protein
MLKLYSDEARHKARTVLQALAPQVRTAVKAADVLGRYFAAKSRVLEWVTGTTGVLLLSEGVVAIGP